MADRSRRTTAGQGYGAVKSKNALEALKAAREGGLKRVEAYEYRGEEAVYDVVDEDKYAKIVAERRQKGSFVVDDEDGSYRDLGEDDYWNNVDEGEEDEDELAGAEEDDRVAGSKKRKAEGSKDGQKSKKKAGEAAVPAAPAGANIHKMFAKAHSQAAQRAAISSGPSHAQVAAAAASSDDVLADILGDLGAQPSAVPTRPSVTSFMPTAPSFLPRTAASTQHQQSNQGVSAIVMRPAVPSSSFRPSSVPSMPPPAPVLLQRPGPAPSKPSLASIPSSRTSVLLPKSLIHASAGLPPAYEPSPQYDDLPAADDMPSYEAARNDEHAQDPMDIDKPSGVPENVPLVPQPQSDAGHGVAAIPDVHMGSNQTPPNSNTRQAAGRMFAEAPATPEDASAAASGWASLYDTQATDDSLPQLQSQAPKDSSPGSSQPAASPLPDSSPVPASLSDQSAALPPLPLDTQGRLPFYYMDAYENSDSRPGEVFLFGKVQLDDKWQSCCTVVSELQRSLLVIPKREVFADTDGEIARLEEVVKQDPSKKIELIMHLQERCGALRHELRELLSKHGVRKYQMAPVKRNYAFEDKNVPHGMQWVLKVRYPAAQGTALPLSPSGNNFITIFGTQQNALEAFLLKRKIKGPGWLMLKGPQRVEYGNQMSWCKVELAMSDPKHVSSQDLPAELQGRAMPPLTVAALSLKTLINPSTQQHEVVSASVVYLPSIQIDSTQEWNHPRMLRHFSIVRKLDGQAWPPGFEQAVAVENNSARGRANGGNMISVQGSERSLLTCLLARLQALDADVMVGHNIGNFDLSILLHRMQHHKVPLWSRIGRLKRNQFPKLTGGGHAFGGGASQGIMTAIAGRLLCDTYVSARELVKEVDYTLKTLSASLLKEQRQELAAADVPARFGSTNDLLGLLRHTECDAWLTLGLTFRLEVLALTHALTQLSGNVWSRTLQGARAQRIEMLLLHEFHARKFILPDKLTAKEKERQRKAEHDEMDEGDEEGAGGGKKSGGGKGPQYAGGLVLEPKKGLYDKIVILLDFNSLYPSIIQEFNICFTTVDRPEDGLLPPLPQSAGARSLAPLPTVIQGLVQKRRQVKQAMGRACDPVTRSQLNVRQQAIKLTANSMYGCLGFSNSRFYAKPLAELITSQGRSILQSTVDLVHSSIGAEVIYGDTDSIMVHTATYDLNEACALGQRIKAEVNKRYKLLEIELDGVFKTMLLLKKKKYAAVKLESWDGGQVVEVVEQKGLDIVRRDWCPLSKEVGNYVLTQVLSGHGPETVVADIHGKLRSVAEDMRTGKVPLGKFIITKQLTKDVKDYPDARTQPHVQVAIRRRAAGKRDGVMQGETVPYIICVKRDAEGKVLDSSSSAALAERAYHPEEIHEDQSLAIDIEYYLGQQVHPVVSRLCAPIDGTDAAHLAECLGLDPSRYKGAAAASTGDSLEDDVDGSGGLLDDDSNFENCDKLMLTARNGTKFEFKGVGELLKGATTAEALLTPPDAVGDESTLLTKAQLINQVVLAARHMISRYYDGQLCADDELNPISTRNVVLAPSGEAGKCRHPDPARQGVLLSREFSEKRLYLQLCYLYRLFHVDGAVRRRYEQLRQTDRKSTVSRADLVAMVPESLRRTCDAVANAIDSYRSASDYHWVHLDKLFEPLRRRTAAS